MRKAINLGYTGSTYWLKVGIENNLNETNGVYLVNKNPYLEHFEIYVMTDNGLQDKMSGGSKSPSANKPYIVTLKPNTLKTLFIK